MYVTLLYLLYWWRRLLFSDPDILESRGLHEHVISDKIIPRDPKNSALIPHTESFSQSAS